MRKAAVGNIARIAKKGKIFLSLLNETWRRMQKVQVSSLAGSLAYTTVLSIAPLIAVLFYVFKLFGGLEWAYASLMPYLLEILSEGTGEIVEHHLQTFVLQVQAKAVGWAGIAGLAITSIMTYLSVVAAFNRIWEIDHPRSLQHRLLRAITLLSIGPVLLTASIAVTGAVAARINSIPYSGQLIAYLLSTILFAMVYSLVPMVKVPFRVIAFGSLVPAFFLETAKFGYAVYTKKMVSYSAFYGSFAAIPLFLLWIYIAWYITLFGAVWVRTLQLHKKELERILG